MQVNDDAASFEWSCIRVEMPYKIVDKNVSFIRTLLEHSIQFLTSTTWKDVKGLKVENIGQSFRVTSAQAQLAQRMILAKHCLLPLKPRGLDTSETMVSANHSSSNRPQTVRAQSHMSNDPFEPRAYQSKSSSRRANFLSFPLFTCYSNP